MNPDVSNNVGPTLESNNSPKLVANTVKKKKVVKSPYNAHLSWNWFLILWKVIVSLLTIMWYLEYFFTIFYAM